jgi:carbamoyl-phosphate synthase large subunit
MNVMLTSVGRRTYLVEYFKEALEGIGRVHASNSDFSIALPLADAYLITPLIYDDTYIPSLLEYCQTNDIQALISLFDIDLLVLAKNREKFEKIGVQLVLASEESVEICNDKWKTYQLLLEMGIKAPKTYLQIEEARKTIDRGEVSFPLIIKPRWGMGSLAIYTVDDDEELKVLYKKSAKEVFNSYLKYETLLTPEHPLIIQEKLVGMEYGLDIINDLDGNYITTFAKTKTVMRAGETDIGNTVSSEPFVNIAENLSRKIRHQAILSVDCFVCGNQVYVVEMNCRISGHYPLSHLAGVNLPLQIVKWLEGKSTDLSLLTFQTGLTIAKELVPRVIVPAPAKSVTV